MSHGTSLNSKQALSTLSSSTSEIQKSGIHREFLLLDIQSKKRILSDEIQAQILSKFDCRSIIIAEMCGEQKDSNYGYRIGIHSLNASKHTYKKITKALFPSDSPGDFKPRAIKGRRSWARSLCEKNFKIVSFWGELQSQELFELTKKEKKKVSQKRKGVAPSMVKFFDEKGGRPLLSLSRKIIFYILRFILALGSWSLSLFKSAIRFNLNKIVWFFIAYYVLFYKNGIKVTPETFSNINEVISWLLDWQTPGLPLPKTPPTFFEKGWKLVKENVNLWLSLIHLFNSMLKLFQELFK